MSVISWVQPTTRSTGDLITASIWNTDLVNDLQYLHDNTLSLSAGSQPTMQQIVSAPNPAGPNSGDFAFTEGGIAFTNACLFAWASGLLNFSDAGHSTPVTTSDFQWTVVASGKNVSITFNNANGANRYPQMRVTAIGY